MAKKFHVQQPALVLPVNPYPGEFTATRLVDWRMCYAMYIATNKDPKPSEHWDGWMQAALDFVIAREDEWQKREISMADRAIFRAIEIRTGNSLAKHALEARLLAEIDVQLIADRCREPVAAICAYAKLLFDVYGPHRPGQWLLKFGYVRHTSPDDVEQLGGVIKELGVFQYPKEALEEFIAVVAHLSGKTLGDGLPERDTPEFLREVEYRRLLLIPSLTKTRPVQKPMKELEVSLEEDGVSGARSAKTIDLTLAILGKAKIPKAWRKEIKELRKLYDPPAGSVLAMGPPGTAVK